MKMTVIEFNKCLKSNNPDERSRVCNHIIYYLRMRLKYRVDYEEREHIAFEILENVLLYSAEHFITAPCSFLNKCVENYLATYFKNNEKIVQLNEDCVYEVRYPELEYDACMNLLMQYLSRLDAVLIYMYVIQKYKHKEIAEYTGLSYANVRHRYIRNMKKLKEQIKF